MSNSIHPQIGETRNYGLNWQEPDHRDYKFTAVPMVLPSVVDLRDPINNPVLDQKDCGSCTANAAAVLLRFNLLKEKYQWMFFPSVMYIYDITRQCEGTSLSVDSGAVIRDVYSAISQLKVCTNEHFPYDASKFADPIPIAAINNSKLHSSCSYYAVNQDLISMKTCLANGFPFTFGTAIYESFESRTSISTGYIPIPNTATEKCLGGHCMVVMGYKDSSDPLNGNFIIQNSWSTAVGEKGYFFIPYSYMLNPQLVSDMWTVRSFK
jgi:C1A family cysteine protease